MISVPKRLIAATLIAATLMVASGAIPANAYSGDTTVVTVRGHVTEPDGTPVKGVVAQSDCGCGGSTGKYSLGRDITSSTGFYSFKVERQYALNIGFNHPDEKFRGVGRSSGTTTNSGTGYIIDVTMRRNSVISGTILSSDGTPSPFAYVRVYNAKTGKVGGSSHHTNKTTGTFEVFVKPGDYKILFGGATQYVTSTWYGGFATRGGSPTVSVGYGETVSGIDGSVTEKPRIEGSITIDGVPGSRAVRERIAVTLFDSLGAKVHRTVVSSGFTFVNLPPGNYTVDARPLESGPAWVQPLSIPVTVLANPAATKLVLDLVAVTPSVTDQRTVGIEFNPVTKGIAKSGKPLAGKIIFSSYGNVAGGKALIYVDGKKVDSRIVPASGRINWRFTPKSVEIGTFSVRVKFLGTDTTRASNRVVYALGGV